LIRLVAIVMLALLAAPCRPAELLDLEPAREALRRQQFQAAIELLRPAAAAGNVEAAFLLAQLLRTGRGGTRDVAESCRLLESSAVLGFARAAGSLAAMLESGECVASSRTADEWRAAADLPGRFPGSAPPDDTSPASPSPELLFRAARDGDIAGIRRLVTAVPPDAVDAFGRNALMIAIEHGQEPAARELVGLGVPANSADRNGDTPLLLAVRGSLPSTSALLLQHGALADASGPLGVTPLMLAARAGNAAIVEQLLAAGASVEKRDAQGLRAGDHAAVAGNAALAERLGVGARPASPARATQPARMAGPASLLDAAESGDVEQLRRELAAGADVNAEGRDGMTAVASAARGASHASVAALLQQGASPHTPDDAGRTPLMFAAMADDVESIRLLMAAGAHVDATDGRGRSPLWHAASSNASRAAAALARPPVLDLADADAVTPLLVAASRGHTAVTQVLLKAGADVKRRSRNGNGPLHAAAAAGRTPVIALLLSAGAGLDEVNGNGDTALHLAVQARCAACVRDLLAAGASTRLRNAGGLTAPDVARRSADPDIIRLFDA